jgi:hypothetical protein
MKFFQPSLIRDKHISLYWKLMIYFPIFYLITTLSQYSIDKSKFDLISTIIVVILTFLTGGIAKLISKKRKELSDKIIESYVLLIIFVIPFIILYGAYANARMGSDPNFYILIYYISIVACSICLYNEELVIFFYIKNILLGFFICFILHPNYVLSWKTMDVLFIHPILILGVGGVQYVSIKYFKLDVTKELEIERKNVQNSEQIQYQMASFYENLSVSGMDGVIAVNKEMKVSFINKYVIENEYSRNLVLGKDIDNLLLYFKLPDPEKFKKTIDKSINVTCMTEHMGCLYEGQNIHIFITPIFTDDLFTGLVINTRKV